MKKKWVQGARVLRSLAVIFVSLACLDFNLAAERVDADNNFYHWRGPKANGNVGEGKFPTQWSEESVKWKVEIAGRGGSTPIVADGKIFFTAGIDGENVLFAYSFEGKEVWRKSFGHERAGKHQKASGSNSSPISDGNYIYAYFKSGDLACCDLDGKLIWEHNIQSEYGEDTLWWDLGTSPVLTDSSVIVAVMQSGPSFLVAFDKETGKQQWLTKRELNVNQESNQAYTTPAVGNTKNGQVVLTVGADYLTAHDARTGEELWRIGSFNPTNHQYFRSIASPLIVGEYVLCPYARGDNLTCVKYAADIDQKDRQVWQRTDLGVDVPTPAASGNRAYLCGDKGEITCIDAATGKTAWSHSLPKSRHAFSASPLIAGGNVYCLREDGETYIFRDADEFELVAQNKLDTSTVSSPIAVDNKIIIRSFNALYCIESK